MTDQPKLKACPFCGGTAVKSVGRYANGTAWHYVECVRCGASCDSVESWNTRPAPPTPDCCPDSDCQCGTITSKTPDVDRDEVVELMAMAALNTEGKKLKCLIAIFSEHASAMLTAIESKYRLIPKEVKDAG